MENNVKKIQHWWRKSRASNVVKKVCVNCEVEGIFVHGGLCDGCYYYKSISRKRRRASSDSEL